MCAALRTEPVKHFSTVEMNTKRFVDEDDNNNLFVTVKLWLANVIRDEQQLESRP